ncbi:hypothetical protein K4F52_009472 [Lecanicillium sp. MT-2017a]|nr:hypothetical protein K4F52_009472 [Lecanicillium sp. MT-2017a]
MMAKRKPTSSAALSGDGAKRQAREPFAGDELSVMQEAEPHRLATAKLPFGALNCQWADGSNRELKDAQVTNLRGLFRTNSILRTADENFLVVKCSRDAVDRMLKHLEAQGHSAAAGKTSLLSFLEWLRVNPGVKLEVLAGQHRMAALREEVRETGADDGELWWTCIILDEELPFDLDVKLRTNRPGTTLRDSHGQIWSQLVLAEALARKQGKTLFDGNKAAIERRLLDILQLGTEKFPVSRLLTLWNKTRWREVLTRWSATAVGAANFEISTFAWMSSLRVDGYWLGYLEDALQTLHALPGKVSKAVGADDWELLVAEVPLGASEEARENLFFPDQSKGANRGRRKGFLRRVPDSEYEDILKHILHDLTLEFRDVASLLKTTKTEGRIIAQAVGHVVDWLNDKPTGIVNRQQNDKPQLRDDFMPALIRHGRHRGIKAAHLDDVAAEDCRHLEELVIESVRDNMAFFTSEEGKTTLGRRLREDADGYGARFAYKEWTALLSAVEVVFGGESPLPWKASSAHELANEKESSLKTMEQSIQQAICANTWIARNETFGGKTALLELSADISDTIRRWLVRMEAKEDGRPERTGNGLHDSAQDGEGRTVRAEEYEGDELLDNIEWTPSPSFASRINSQSAAGTVEKATARHAEAISREGSKVNGQPTGSSGNARPAASRTSTPPQQQADAVARLEKPPRSNLPLSKPTKSRQQPPTVSQPSSQVSWATGPVAGSAKRKRLP